MKQWGQQSQDDGMLLLDVCYGKGRFVAIGMLGQIVHSDVIPATARKEDGAREGISRESQTRRKK
jgi:hypothetical protein